MAQIDVRPAGSVEETREHRVRVLPAGMVPLGDYKRVGGFMGLREQIGRLGGNATELMRASGLKPADFDDPDSYIHYPSAIRLLEDCAARLNAPFFGFELGKSQDVEVLGPLSTLLLAAPTVGEGLALMERYMPVHAPGARFESKIEGGLAHVSYRILSPEASGMRQINELSMAVSFGIIRMLVGPELAAREVHISSPPPPRRSDAMEEFFGTSIDYDCTASCLVLPSVCLAKAIDGNNPALLNASRRFLESFAQQDFADITGQVRKVIRQLLPTGECSLALTAMHLSMHPRVLQHRLNERGSEFRELLRQERLQLAKTYLVNARTPLAEIAMLLGYSDQASFTRAFTGWTDLSPYRFRKAAIRRDAA